MNDAQNCIVARLDCGKWKPMFKIALGPTKFTRYIEKPIRYPTADEKVITDSFPINGYLF
jgi:hypothetical protein